MPLKKLNANHFVEKLSCVVNTHSTRAHGYSRIPESQLPAKCPPCHEKDHSRTSMRTQGRWAGELHTQATLETYPRLPLLARDEQVLATNPKTAGGGRFKNHIPNLRVSVLRKQQACPTQGHNPCFSALFSRERLDQFSSPSLSPAMALISGQHQIS